MGRNRLFVVFMEKLSPIHLKIEFIDLENIYTEVFDGTAIKEYTKEQLLDFIDDLIQLFNSVISVVAMNWKNIETVKKIMEAGNILQTLENRVNIEPEQEDDMELDGIFI